MANAVYSSTLPGQISTQRHELVMDANTDVEVTTSSTTIHQITIDNSANSHITYLKLYNAATGSVTVGGTNPDILMACAASSTIDYSFDPGITLGTAVTAATVQEAGTSGTTAPGSAVTVVILSG